MNNSGPQSINVYWMEYERDRYLNTWPKQFARRHEGVKRVSSQFEWNNPLN